MQIEVAFQYLPGVTVTALCEYEPFEPASRDEPETGHFYICKIISRVDADHEYKDPDFDPEAFERMIVEEYDDVIFRLCKESTEYTP